MTEPHGTDEAAETAEVMPEQEIEFAGRTLWVKMPSPEQLLVWKRTLRKLQGADVEGWNGEQVMSALERTRAIIDSVLAHEVDKDWLDDEMLAGTIGLKDTAQLIQMTVEAFASAAEAEGNRETRRAAAKKAAPAKKATRKKAARS